MNLFPSEKPDYRARIERARLLSARYPFAAEVLRFYEGVAKFQGELFEQLNSRSSAPAATTEPGKLRSQHRPKSPRQHFVALLKLLEKFAPSPIRHAAARLAKIESSEFDMRFASCWSGGRANSDSDAAAEQDRIVEDLIFRIFLQPEAEFFASSMEIHELGSSGRTCPRCESLPLLGVLRPESDGAKRFLMCSFCLQEWESRRIFCASCGEEDEKKLPVYVAEQFPQIRVECCDTCKFFLRTVDLLKEGHAEPLVDDLAAIPLTLWAHEHSYSRIAPNLLGS
ncbi:MAG TPA: formate dehydrogenase accessory protein FdhE [Candidatus Acidoferrales bacterium]|nr:formate dehydrogenase accessory protein FdhE [Candidatus Acidoferrales bacterium]